VQVIKRNLLQIDWGHIQPNKTIKCSTQELTQGGLPMTIVFTQRFQIQQKEGWFDRLRFKHKANKM